jgi:LysM repeat protein
MGAWHARRNGAAGMRGQVMVSKALLCTAAMMLAFPATVMAQSQPNPELQALDDALPGILINDPTRLDWDIFGTGQTSKPVKGNDIPGGKAAVQISVPKAGATLYEIGANVPITPAIKSGSDVVVAFYARTVSAGTADGMGRIGVRFQQNAAPYSGFGDTTLLIEKEWKLYQVAAKANLDIPKGQAIVSYQLSGAKQVIEIGQTIIVSGATSLTTKSSKSVQSATTDLLPQLQGKGKLISNPTNKDWAVYGAGETHSTIPSPNIPGTGGTALLVKTAAAAANPYEIGAVVPITDSIAEGDIILVAVLARTSPGSAADGVSKLGIRVQANEPPYPGFGDNTLTLGPNWRLLQIKTQAQTAIAAGKGVLGLHFGGAAQSIEVGQVYVINTSLLSPIAPVTGIAE